MTEIFLYAAALTLVVVYSILVVLAFLLLSVVLGEIFR